MKIQMYVYNRGTFQSEWPCGLRHEIPSFTRTLLSSFQIPFEAWMYAYVYSVCVLLRLRLHPFKESYQPSVGFIVFRLTLNGKRPNDVIRQEEEEGGGGGGGGGEEKKKEEEKEEGEQKWGEEKKKKEEEKEKKNMRRMSFTAF
jgi:hypothetical protein